MSVAMVLLLAGGIAPLMAPRASAADQSWMVPGHWFTFNIHIVDLQTGNVSDTTYTARIVTVSESVVRVNETFAVEANSTTTENDISRLDRAYLTSPGGYAWFWVNEVDLNQPMTNLATKTVSFVSATSQVATFSLTEPGGNTSTLDFTRTTLVLERTTDQWVANGQQYSGVVTRTGEGSSGDGGVEPSGSVEEPSRGVPPSPRTTPIIGTRGSGEGDPGIQTHIQSFSPPWNFCVPNAVRSTSAGGVAGITRANFPCNANTGRGDNDVAIWTAVPFGWAFARGTSNSRGPQAGQFTPQHTGTYHITLTYTILSHFTQLGHTDCGWWGCGYVHQFAWVEGSVFSTSSPNVVARNTGSVYWGYCFPVPLLPCIEGPTPLGTYTVALGTVTLQATQSYYFILQHWAEHYALTVGLNWNSSIGIHTVRFDTVSFDAL